MYLTILKDKTTKHYSKNINNISPLKKSHEGTWFRVFLNLPFIGFNTNKNSEWLCKSHVNYNMKKNVAEWPSIILSQSIVLLLPCQTQPRKRMMESIEYSSHWTIHIFYLQKTVDFSFLTPITLIPKQLYSEISKHKFAK